MEEKERRKAGERGKLSTHTWRHSSTPSWRLYFKPKFWRERTEKRVLRSIHLLAAGSLVRWYYSKRIAKYRCLQSRTRTINKRTKPLPFRFRDEVRKKASSWWEWNQRNEEIWVLNGAKKSMVVEPRMCDCISLWTSIAMLSVRTVDDEGMNWWVARIRLSMTAFAIDDFYLVPRLVTVAPIRAIIKHRSWQRVADIPGRVQPVQSLLCL